MRALHRLQPLRNLHRTIWILPLISLLASAFAFWQTRAMVEGDLHSLLELRTKRVKFFLEQNLTIYDELLRGLQTHFVLNPDLPPPAFRHVYQALEAPRRLHGIQAIGYSDRVDLLVQALPETPGRHAPGMDARNVASSLHTPSPPLAYAYRVRHIEPQALHRQHLGVNQGLEPQRRAAIERARDSGRLAATGLVQLLGSSEAGVVFFLPVYRGGPVPDSLQERRDKFSGVLFMTIRIDQVLQELVRALALTEADIALFESGKAAGEDAGVAAPQRIVFDSAALRTVRPDESSLDAYHLQEEDTVNLGAIAWRLRMTARAEFVSMAQRGLPFLVALAGLFISALSYLLVRRLIHSSQRAESRADRAEDSLQKQRAQLHYQVNYDVLTGLANRQSLLDRTQALLSQASARGSPVWALGINLDRFKFVNESMGHEAGNAVLEQTAQRLRSVLHPSDLVARLGSDDFAVVSCTACDEQGVLALAHRLRDALARPFEVASQDCYLSCSIGVAVYPGDASDAATLLKHADVALHRAKEMGRNGLQFYTALMKERATNRLQLEGELRQALQRKQLLLHYQPQVDLRSGAMIGMEVLLRWNHPHLGAIAPNRFIPLAEETGLMVPLGNWVLRTACLQSKAWQDAGFPPLRLGVNLSSNQFYQPGLAASIAAMLKDTGLEAQWLDIEITEGIVMRDVNEAISIMRSLKELGVKLSIDDFGTGYSSLAYLKLFPIDVLKIDQSFVQSLTESVEDAAIVDAIITMARTLRLKVIAEGVETQTQLEYLRSRHCDEMQGYCFSRPLPAQDFEQLLLENKRLPLNPQGQGAEDRSEPQR